jgi:hypothetical protein
MAKRGVWLHSGETQTNRLLAAGVVTPMTALNLFLLLAMGHSVADFALRGDRMATEKYPGQGLVLHWSWWLTAHAAIHGFLWPLHRGALAGA